jgi:hypothetical protein
VYTVQVKAALIFPRVPALTAQLSKKAGAIVALKKALMDSVFAL